MQFLCPKSSKICTVRQGRSSRLKGGGAQGGTIFSSNFMLHFWAIWKNDPFSKSQKVPGLKPRLARRVLRPWNLPTASKRTQSRRMKWFPFIWIFPKTKNFVNLTDIFILNKNQVIFPENWKEPSKSKLALFIFRESNQISENVDLTEFLSNNRWEILRGDGFVFYDIEYT